MWNNYGAMTALCLLGAYLTSQHIQYWTINHPANAWTSLIYAFPVVPLYVKMPLYVLAMASFGLWANSNVYNHFIDVTSILWIPIITAVYIHPSLSHKMRFAYFVNFAFITFMSVSLYTDYFHIVAGWYNHNIVPTVGTITVASYFVVLPYYYRVRKYQLSCIMTLAGFGAKLTTIYGGFYYGTAIFHALTALSLCVLVRVRYTPPVRLDKCEQMCLV